MLVDGGRMGRSFLVIKLKARAVVGRGEKSLRGDPGSDFRGYGGKQIK